MVATAAAYADRAVDLEDLEECAANGLIVHVLIIDGDGYPRWHRYLAQTAGSLTACDEPQRVRSADILDIRIEMYDGELCHCGCFSKSELAQAATANAERRNRVT